MAKQGECAQCGEVGPLRTGLCFRDYGMKWRAEKAKTPCSMKGCTSGVKVAGLCDVHYNRKRKREALELELAYEEEMKRREQEMIVMGERQRILAILTYYKYRGNVSIDQLIQEVSK